MVVTLLPSLADLFNLSFVEKHPRLHFPTPVHSPPVVALAGALEDVLAELSTSTAHLTDGEDLEHGEGLLQDAEGRVSRRLKSQSITGEGEVNSHTQV